MRREWIEIDDAKMADWQGESPSMRREWIEIRKDCSDPAKSRSPSMRREWIEMISWQFQSAGTYEGDDYAGIVSLHAEGVD